MRAIDIEKLIENLRRYKHEVISVDELVGVICLIPSAQPEPKWIPCSERLPENSNTVLITHRGGVSFGWYNGRYWERGASNKHRLIKTVTAWMPLPEPYQEGEQDG